MSSSQHLSTTHPDFLAYLSALHSRASEISTNLSKLATVINRTPPNQVNLHNLYNRFLLITTQFQTLHDDLLANDVYSVHRTVLQQALIKPLPAATAGSQPMFQPNNMLRTKPIQEIETEQADAIQSILPSYIQHLQLSITHVLKLLQQQIEEYNQRCMDVYSQVNELYTDWQSSEGEKPAVLPVSAVNAEQQLLSVVKTLYGSVR